MRSRTNDWRWRSPQNRRQSPRNRTCLWSRWSGGPRTGDWCPRCRTGRTVRPYGWPLCSRHWTRTIWPFGWSARTWTDWAPFSTTVIGKWTLPEANTLSRYVYNNIIQVHLSERNDRYYNIIRVIIIVIFFGVTSRRHQSCATTIK